MNISLKKGLLFFSIIAVTFFLTAVSYAFSTDDSNGISRRIAEEKVELEKIRSEMVVLDIKIADAERSLDERRMALADARERLRAAEDRYQDSMDQYGKRLSSIYKMGGNNMVKILFSSEDFTDAASRLAYLSIISENDMKMIERVKAEAEEVRQLHEVVDELKQDQAGNVDELKLRRQELAMGEEQSRRQIEDNESQLSETRAREMEELAAQSYQNSLPEVGSGQLGQSILLGGSEPPEGLMPTGTILTGVASWYGPGFHGNRTANGEIYDMYAFTAAHKTLPFNTWLKVTYNGRSVFVRINDRGPYVGERFLDLSLSASQAIGMYGVGYVTAEVYM